MELLQIKARPLYILTGTRYCWALFYCCLALLNRRMPFQLALLVLPGS